MTSEAGSFGTGGERLEKSLREEWGTLLLWCLVLGCFLGAMAVFHRMTAPRGVPLGVVFSTAQGVRASEMQTLTLVRAFVAWHNLQGGTPQFRLEEASYDADPSQAVEELARREVRAVVGFFASASAEAARHAGERWRIPVVASGASASFFDRQDDWLFRTRGSTEDDAAAYVTLCRRAGVRNLVVLHFEGNDAYRTAFVRDMVVQKGPRVLKTLPYLHVMGENFSPLSAGPQSPDGVLVVGPSVPSVWMGQRARQVWPQAVVLLAPWALVSLTAEEGRLLGEGVLAAEKIAPGRADEKHSFVRFWRERFGETPLGVVEHNTFLAMQWVLEALKNAGGGGGEALRRSLAQPQELWGIGSGTRVDAWGDAHGLLAPLRMDPRGEFQEMEP